MRAYSATPAVASLPSAAPPLTPDAAAVLSRAAGDALRRRHAHTTPLHAAAALLSGPAPLLRDACVAGLASPHPLRCRALDLCFAVALDRLPTSTEHHHDGGGGFHAMPPLSNALTAALKRAYAHHRRIGGSGGVEADDHRVGVPHLVLAILDDPSVARVMREASFSSTAVKAAMLRSLSDPAVPDSGLLVSARLLHRQSPNREEEVAKVVEVLKRGSKRNPVLVGDTTDVDAVVQEVVTMIQRQRLGDAQVISFPKEFGNLVDMDRAELVAKIKKLGEVIRSELLAPASKSAGVVVNLGNLQWLVEERCVAFGEQENRRDVVLGTARAAVAEMARILRLSCEGEHRVWVIGTATCATYLKCQVYHPALESEWDLQAVPITPRPPPTPSSLGLSPSVGANRGILSSSVEVLSSAMTGAMQRAPSLCNACVDGYERERAEIAAADVPLHPRDQPMSQWLQIGTPRPLDSTQDKAREADDLRRRWLDRCAHLHHGRPSAVTCSEWNGATVLGNMQAMAARPSAPPPPRTVDTDLALGPAASTSPASACDTDEKVLVRLLVEAVRWQADAAVAVANTIVKVKSGESNRRSSMGPKADTWILFAGADVVGKRRMAGALSQAVFGTGAVTVRLSCPTAGDDGGESIVSWRGRTALDRVAAAIRANPFRVIVLDGLDQADTVVHGAIVRAVESGRLVDSDGRDVAVGSAIFVIMSSWSSSPMRTSQEEVSLAGSPWNLELRASPKRRPEQSLDGDDRRTKPRKDAARDPLPLDLNLSMCDDHADDDDSGGEGSRNSSSDLTVEHGQEYAAKPSAAESNMPELIRVVDGIAVFKPVNMEPPLKRSVSDVASAKFGDVAASEWSVHVDRSVLDRLSGAAWRAGASATSLEAWAGEVLCPSMRQLKRSFSTNDADGATTPVSLSAVAGIARSNDGDMFPTTLTVAVDGN